MIRVILAPEPPMFHEGVRLKGLRAIDELVGQGSPRKGRPRKIAAADRESISPDLFPSIWTEALPHLMSAYNSICAYSCFRIHKVTGAASVDHMVAKSRAWDKIYEWDNYRLACSRLNARKRDFTDVLDPFEVQDDWFHLDLVSFQVIPNKAIDDETIRSRIDDTIKRLGLGDFDDARAEDAEAYWSRDISFSHLQKESPFVARELIRQNQLNQEDIH